VLSPALPRTPLATEAQHLLARYVFESLNYRRTIGRDSPRSPKTAAAND
jgi:RimJ/RimL family protein N-acetyltransferase